MIKLAIRRLSLICLTIALVPLVGCKEELISEYDAPREEQERLLAVMMPQGKSTWWYFVLKGPATDVTAHVAQFDKFINTVTFVDNKPTWTQPDEWKRKPKPGRRFAIFLLGNNDPPLELTVSKLDGPEAGDVLMNVNRWRDQVGLGALLESEIGPFVSESKINGLTVNRVDLTGPGGLQMQMGGTLASEPITYEMPNDWKKIKNPPDRMRDTRRWATFEASAGGKTAEVSILIMGVGGSDLDNVARWRRMVKLPEGSEEERKRHVREGFRLAGESALYADITGEGSDAQRILGVILRHGKFAWAFKLQGPAAVVAAQQSTFDKFLETVKFPESGEDD